MSEEDEAILEEFEEHFDHYNPIHDNGVDLPYWNAGDWGNLKSFLKQALARKEEEMLEKFKDCLPSHKEGIKNKKDEEYGFSYPHCDECRGYEECNCEGFNECLSQIKDNLKPKGNRTMKRLFEKHLARVRKENTWENAMKNGVQNIVALDSEPQFKRTVIDAINDLAEKVEQLQEELKQLKSNQ